MEKNKYLALYAKDLHDGHGAAIIWNIIRDNKLVAHASADEECVIGLPDDFYALRITMFSHEEPADVRETICVALCKDKFRKVALSNKQILQCAINQLIYLVFGDVCPETEFSHLYTM